MHYNEIEHVHKNIVSYISKNYSLLSYKDNIDNVAISKDGYSWDYTINDISLSEHFDTLSSLYNIYIINSDLLDDKYINAFDNINDINELYNVNIIKELFDNHNDNDKIDIDYGNLNANKLTRYISKLNVDKIYNHTIDNIYNSGTRDINQLLGRSVINIAESIMIDKFKVIHSKTPFHSYNINSIDRLYGTLNNLPAIKYMTGDVCKLFIHIKYKSHLYDYVSKLRNDVIIMFVDDLPDDDLAYIIFDDNIYYDLAICETFDMGFKIRIRTACCQYDFDTHIKLKLSIL